MSRSEITLGRVRMAAAATVLVVASGSLAAHAQQEMPEMMQGGGMQMGHEEMMGAGAMCHMGQHVDGRLAYLKAELKITEAQTPQWNAYADAVRAAAQKMAQHCAMMKEHGGAMMSADLPERLNMMEQHMTMRLDSMRATKAAVEALYSVLSHEQKKTANEIMKGPMGMM